MKNKYPEKAGTYIVYTTNRMFLIKLIGRIPQLKILTALDMAEFMKGKVIAVTDEELAYLSVLDFSNENIFWLPLFHGIEIPTKELLPFIDDISSVTIIPENLKEWEGAYVKLRKDGMSDAYAVAQLKSENKWSFEIANTAIEIVKRSLKKDGNDFI
jgi:hypothetical protein